MHAGAERRASLATAVQGNISPQETGQVLTLKANPVRNLPVQIPLKRLLTTIALVPVKGFDEKKIVQISCGQQHSIALDEDGYVFAHLTLEVSLMGFLTQSCVCLGLQWLLPSGPWESERCIKSSGCSPGRSRVTLVSSSMWADIFARTKFAGPHKQYLGARVSAGPSSSVVIDRQGMYYVAGKVSFWFFLSS